MYCPLRFVGRDYLTYQSSRPLKEVADRAGLAPFECEMDKCAWWDEEDKRCCMKALGGLERILDGLVYHSEDWGNYVTVEIVKHGD